MKFTTLEARTEEEFIGNLLLVSLNQCTLSEADALKALWIEVQEYAAEFTESKKSDDFYYAKDNFYFKEVQVEEFFVKVHAIFSKFDNYSNKTKKDVKLIEDFLLSGEKKINLVSVLHEGFTDYDVFISLQDEYMLFSWTDVI